MPSFDVVSQVDMQEVRNAVDQANREIVNRFDFKDTGTIIELGDDSITVRSSTDHRLEAAVDVLEGRLVKRKVPLKALDKGQMEDAAGSTVRQEIGLNQGIDQERAKKIVKSVKDTKLKVQAAVQGDQVRISGKKRDDLQSVMQLLRDADYGIPLQFTNRRD